MTSSSRRLFLDATTVTINKYHKYHHHPSHVLKYATDIVKSTSLKLKNISFLAAHAKSTPFPCVICPVKQRRHTNPARWRERFRHSQGRYKTREQQENPAQGRVRKRLAPATAKTSRAKAKTRCVGMVPCSYRKSRREVGCASPSSLPPSRGDVGSPPCGLPRPRCEPRATCWEPGDGRIPVCSLLALPTVVLAACRCSQHSDSSWGRNRKRGDFLGVLPMLCCRP